ncbi:hypothetical protein C900_00998 [Fulvivirga imtechensis AK7]|uniref:Uncharacterized protein n=1 Tax=Fulvivirga imtechensis AK7 TaxID=1237149 RepID=L8JY93_9BACT|nr:hypothetical protein [Fulvivirga imtechensis]ELR72619.1 hypothetical protein C900_00998 [Fulvivirga imtechensis AK7]
MNRSDFLFSKMNFLTGAGSVLNIAGNYYSFNSSKNEREADLKAIKSDWCSVGEDISHAYKTMLSE